MMVKNELERVQKETPVTYFKALLEYLPESTEEESTKIPLQWSVYRLKLELGTFRIQVRSFTAWLACFVWSVG
jgi:hypothetical protein